MIEQLLALPDEPARRALLEAHAHTLTEAEANDLADALKAQADHYLRAELAACWQFTHLLFYWAELRGDEFIRALALRAEGNVLSIGQAHFREAIEKYDEAAAIYREAGRELDEAKSQIGKVFALTNLGRYDEAIRVGEWISRVLRERRDYRALAINLMNVGIAYGKQSNEILALRQFDEALDLHDIKDYANRAVVQWNRSEALRNQGYINEAISAAQLAFEGFSQVEQWAAAASALRTKAEVFFVAGRYNESIEQLERSRGIFEADLREEDVAITDWLISDCLLALRKYLLVISKCDKAFDVFVSRGERFEAAHVLINAANAHSGLNQYAAAIHKLRQAHELFLSEQNILWVALTDVSIAATLGKTSRHQEAYNLALQSVKQLALLGLPLRLAQAQLVVAKEAYALDDFVQAKHYVNCVQTIAKDYKIPWLCYEVALLSSQIARKLGQVDEALNAIDEAITGYEQLRSNWMIEHRTDFAHDKQIPYTEAAELCLTRGQPARALGYVERAKSRALVDMLIYRVDLSVNPRSFEDEPLTNQLSALQAQRNQLARRLERVNRESRLHLGASEEVQIDHVQKLHQLEQAITEQWHSLLVRNADYARDASLWQVQVEPVQEQLQPGQALVEYAELNGSWVAFVVTPYGVTAHTLPINPTQTQNLLRSLWLNFKTVASAAPANSHALALLANAKELLRRLHAGLVQPIDDALATARHVFVVPHGALHYLPFQALFDGGRSAFWAESAPHTLSYLPCASVLKYCRRPAKPPSQKTRPGQGVAVAFGHSRQGQLPHAPREAQQVARALGGTVFTEGQATVEHFQEAASTADVIHLAMHGDFRADASLFSGLHFEDGMLTTLDTYNLRLTASLVSLSACQTGRGVLGGGDELLGLMRGFLGAGAASLLLSLWRVEDRSTLALMENFYGALAQGQTKAAALRQAQRSVMQQWPHPYFWAPFMLVGDVGPV